MRNKQALIIIGLLILLSACNIPSTQKVPEEPQEKPPAFLWDLDLPESVDPNVLNEPTSTPFASTATPQLISQINFEAAFREGSVSAPAASGSISSSGEDIARWLFFDPAERTTGTVNTLYAAFENRGGSTWNSDYYLEYYAGYNPAETSKVHLTADTAPGERGTFAIPIEDHDSSWKTCWQLKNPGGAAFYEFCYSHGDGSNDGTAPVQAAGGNTGSDNGKAGYWAFIKTNGSAPQKYTSAEQAATVVSTSPSSGHNFDAYDHYESLTVNIRNDGSESWDSSYKLIFYNGYNWMHETEFAVTGTVNSGETVSIRMPMEIIEDNDKWVTCWYLASPEGRNLSDFCFNYYTRSK